MIVYCGIAPIEGLEVGTADQVTHFLMGRLIGTSSMPESALEATIAEAIKGASEERVDEISRAIRREPLKFIGIAALVGFTLALLLSRDAQ